MSADMDANRRRSEADSSTQRIDRIAEPWGTRTPYGRGEEWPVRIDQFLEEGISEEEVDRWAQTASLHHSDGDGPDLAIKDGRIVGVKGRAVDRVSRGRVDPKECHPDTLRALKWTNTKVKETSPQVLMS